MSGPGIDLTRRSFVGILLAAATAPKALATYAPPPEVAPPAAQSVCPKGVKVQFQIRGDHGWTELPPCFEIRLDNAGDSIVWGDRPYNRPIIGPQRFSLRVGGIAFPFDILYDHTPVRFRYFIDDISLETGWLRAVGIQNVYEGGVFGQEIDLARE